MQSLNKAQIEAFWNAQNKQYERLRHLNQESPEQIFGQDQWHEAFAQQPKKVVCIDERVHISDAGKPEICIAGTLVLMDDAQRQITLSRLRQAGITGVTYHEFCGAAGLFKDNHHDDSRSILEIARDAAQKVADELGLPSPQKIGYSQDSDIPMRGINEFHHARIVIVDGSGRFNPGILGIKDSFQSSVYYHPDREYTAKEIELMLGIIMGGHGFGKERFTKTPALVLLVGHESNPEYSIDMILKEYHRVFAKYGDKIKILTVTSPVTKFVL